MQNLAISFIGCFYRLGEIGDDGDTLMSKKTPNNHRDGKEKAGP